METICRDDSVDGDDDYDDDDDDDDDTERHCIPLPCWVRVLDDSWLSWWY